MDYKYLSIILAIILILVIAFVIIHEVLVKKEKEKLPGGEGDETTDTGIEKVFEEPPKDFEPPSLPS